MFPINVFGIKMFARKLEEVGPYIKIKKCCAPHVLETSEEVGEFDTTPSCTHRLRYINNMNQCEINLKVILQYGLITAVFFQTLYMQKVFGM